jgi:hypothetical protein
MVTAAFGDSGTDGSWADELMATDHLAAPHLTADRAVAGAPGGTPLGLLTSPTALLPSSIAALLITVSVIWRMWQLVPEREHARELLRHRATHDELAGLPNRRVLQDLLVSGWAPVRPKRRRRRSGAVL